mmetsp:Transcript_5155/g.14817  ORF Transcript_5155/g.14817 Transcript_5155/m.14817 type:complete len:405 (-) Transcript_5155:532-1746(-)
MVANITTDTEDAVHLSRHFLRLQAHHVAVLPGPLPGPADANGMTTSYKLFAVGAWVEDVQEEHLAVMALVVTSGPEGVARVEPQRLASWRHPGPVTALQVADLGRGEVCIFSGGGGGALCRLQLAMPLAPGATPSDIQLRGGGFEGADLLVAAQLHRGPLSGISVQSDSRLVATCGLDGRIFVLPVLGDLSAHMEEPLVDSGPSTSYWAIAWSSPQTFVTAGTTGGLEVWDRRGGKPVARSPMSWGATGFAELDLAQGTARRISSVAVHPGRPHLAATGSSDGCVAVWDLRFRNPPARAALDDPSAGDVRKVQFDASEAAAGGGAGGGCLLFCTEGGFLAMASPAFDDGSSAQQERGGAGGAAWRAEVLWREPAAAMLAFDAEQDQGRDLMASTDQECLVYISR